MPRRSRAARLFHERAMLLRRWNSRRDPAKRREILEFLATPEAQGMSDRKVARRLLVHHQLVARLRPELAKAGVDDSTSKPTPYPSQAEVDDSSPRPLQREFPTHSKRLADLEIQFARGATEAWVGSFDPRPEPQFKLSPTGQAYRDGLRKLPPGEIPELPDFLDRRGRRS